MAWQSTKLHIRLQLFWLEPDGNGQDGCRKCIVENVLNVQHTHHHYINHNLGNKMEKEEHNGRHG